MMYGQQQAYDRAITVFSPDGRLFQVEYAKEAVRRGATSIGVTFEEGVLLAAVKYNFSKLVVPACLKKIFEIDNHMTAVAAGLIADARKLVSVGRKESERYRILYDEVPPVYPIANYIADVVQAYTQYGGARPFGVSLLLAGYDDKPHLYEIEPSGAMTGYFADSIGENKKEVDAYLEKNYKKGMSSKGAMKLAVSAIKEHVPKDVPYSIEVAVFKKGDSSFTRVPEDMLKKL